MYINVKIPQKAIYRILSSRYLPSGCPGHALYHIVYQKARPGKSLTRNTCPPERNIVQTILGSNVLPSICIEFNVPGTNQFLKYSSSRKSQTRLYLSYCPHHYFFRLTSTSDK